MTSWVESSRLFSGQGLELELLPLSGEGCGDGESTTESEPGGLNTVRPRSPLVAGTMEEMAVEDGDATKVAEGPVLPLFAVQDSGFPVLGGSVRVTLAAGTSDAERSVLPVAM